MNSKNFKICSFQITGKCICQTTLPLQSLTFHVEQSPNKFAQKNLSPICHEKLPSILYGARHYALVPSIGKSCGGVSLNICKKVQNKTC